MTVAVIVFHGAARRQIYPGDLTVFVVAKRITAPVGKLNRAAKDGVEIVSGLKTLREKCSHVRNGAGAKQAVRKICQVDLDHTVRPAGALVRKTRTPAAIRVIVIDGG